MAGKALQFRSQSFWDYVHKLKKSPEFAQLLCSECPNLPCQTLLECQKARVASSGTLQLPKASVLALLGRFLR